MIKIGLSLEFPFIATTCHLSQQNLRWIVAKRAAGWEAFDVDELDSDEELNSENQSA